MAYNYEKLKKNLSQKRRFLTITIISLMVIILFFGRNLIYDYSNYLLSIVYKPYNDIVGDSYDFFDMLQNINQLYNENTILKEKNVKLLQENTNLQYLIEENTELKKNLNYSKTNPDLTYLTAKIYAQDPLNITNLISIDKGSTNGIKIGQNVVYNGIYLGQIIEVNKYTSQVKMLTDPTLQIVAQIPSANTNGIVHGQIGFGMIMQDIPPDATLEIGQLVTTSAIDYNMPENLLIGEIIEIEHTDQDIFQKVIVKPYYNPNDLKFVLVYINDEN